jgi:hypothetical protein
MKTVSRLGFFFFILLIAFVTYSKVLHFTYYIDDWGYLWKSYYQVQSLLTTFLQWGTTLEFFFLSRLFGDKVVLWQLFGILLRVVAAYSVAAMVSTVTRIRRAGIIAGIFFACLPIGIQSVSWISAHIVDIDVIGCSLTLILWIRFWRTGLRTFLWYTLGVFFLALALDPFRVFPLFFILGLFLVFSKSSLKKSNIFLTKVVIGVLCITALIVAIWERQYILESAPYAMLFRNKHEVNGELLLHGMRLIGNYFWSLYNLVFGVFMAPVAPAPHPVFQIVPSIVSAVLFLILLLYSTYIWIKKQKENGFFLLLFTSWILLFFIPCWIFEPRQMVEPIHRYLVLPSVGFVGVLGYLVAKMKHISLALVVVICIMVINMSASHRLLAFEYTYRSADLTEQFWKTIVASVPKNEVRSIFVFQGEEPVRTWTLEISAAKTFTVRRKISDATLLPMVTTDTDRIVLSLCGSKTIPLSHVHAWSVRNNGNIKDISQERKDMLRSMLITRLCKFEE